MLKSGVLAAVGLALAPLNDAAASCGATINGQPMTAQGCQVAAQIYRSRYWIDAMGHWGRVGDSKPVGNIYVDANQSHNSGIYESREGLVGGTGERYDNGAWIHNQAPLLGGGAVGIDGKGCYYTESWSNC